MFSWSALPDLSQHRQGKAAPSRLFSGLQLHYHSVVVALGLIWQWHELQQRKDLSRTAAQQLMPQQEERGTGLLGWGFGGAGNDPAHSDRSCSSMGSGCQWNHTHMSGSLPSLCNETIHALCMNCLLTWITIIYTVKSHELNQLKGGGLGLPEGIDEVGGW